MFSSTDKKLFSFSAFIANKNNWFIIFFAQPTHFLQLLLSTIWRLRYLQKLKRNAFAALPLRRWVKAGKNWGNRKLKQKANVYLDLLWLWLYYNKYKLQNLKRNIIIYFNVDKIVAMCWCWYVLQQNVWQMSEKRTAKKRWCVVQYRFIMHKNMEISIFPPAKAREGTREEIERENRHRMYNVQMHTTF